MQTYIENILVALSSIKENLLRSILTILIIGIGITSLVGILTAIDAVKSSINENFTSMGANTFNIKNTSTNMRAHHNGTRAKKYQPISYREAVYFKNNFDNSCKVSISSLLSRTATAKHEYRKTNPNISIFGVDENYVFNSGYQIANGRNFSIDEISFGRHVSLIGKAVKEKLFPNEKAVGKFFSIGNKKFKIIGVLEEKGSRIGFSTDESILVPITNARNFFTRGSTSYVISVRAQDRYFLESTIGLAISTFRKVRQLKPEQENDFKIVKSDNLSNMLIDNIRYVTIAATLIGFITLVGAAIGLMNIMLVSVTERTKEIGVRKSLGATSRLIRTQFLIESTIVCQLGGIFGIIVGVLIGNLTAKFIGASFVVPWIWIFSAIILCFVVGITSGVLPAIQASKLDPIESLRNE
ncbi:MAG: ABC transporter permease [Bacteroidota bacterium]|nr:ABC transporter permease [Bacteroidota bacterium]